MKLSVFVFTALVLFPPLFGQEPALDAIVVPMSMVALRRQTVRPDLTLRYVKDGHLNQTMGYLTTATSADFTAVPKLTLDHNTVRAISRRFIIESSAFLPCRSSASGSCFAPRGRLFPPFRGFGA